MKKFFLIFSTFFALCTTADPLITIRPGIDPNNYNTNQMKQRIWRLERAVTQLQKRITQLEQDKSNQQASQASWLCTFKAMTDIYTGIGASKSVAKHNASVACQNGGNSFHCRFEKCEN